MITNLLTPGVPLVIFIISHSYGRSCIDIPHGKQGPPEPSSEYRDSKWLKLEEHKAVHRPVSHLICFFEDLSSASE